MKKRRMAVSDSKKISALLHGITKEEYSQLKESSRRHEN